MKCFATICVAVLLQLIYLSSSNGQEDTTKAGDATTTSKPKCSHKEKSDCCSVEDCVYVRCVNEDDEKADGCYDTTEEAHCKNSEDAVNTCGVEATTTAAKPVNCTTFSSKKSECCAPELLSVCSFVVCATQDGVTGTVCAASGTDVQCSDETATAGADTCGQEGPEETTMTTGGEIDCSSYIADQDGCCAAGDNAACIYFNCTSEDGESAGKYCISSDNDPECPDNNTPSANVCKPSGTGTSTPASGQTSTQLPTSGEEEGHQEFDGASFIGGIVLCAGIIAIAYFGVKCYRSRQEKNYQSM